jgi:crotonobetainyl-CoA:carnitine CoA-transferase CaiB-like acyl-CoA transferase
MQSLPLDGITVIDLSTLLPGPLATLLLAEAGARVIKIERPPHGDEMRGFPPLYGETGAAFAMLNRGKESVSLDLKEEEDFKQLLTLLDEADILVEQFRPGVLARLGLTPELLDSRFPQMITCSITGYGQEGERSDEAGHDLVYMARSGLLSLARGSDGAPPVPPVLAADIAGGSWPAVINILLARRPRDRTGKGGRLDSAWTDSRFPFAFRELARGFAGGGWSKGGDGLLTGGSPRYRVYPTRDGRYLAAAPLEQRFWSRFCDLIGLDPVLADDRDDPEATAAAVAGIIASRDAAHWEDLFAGEDVCSAIVASLEEAAADPAFASRDLFRRKVATAAGDLPALPLPLDPGLRDEAVVKTSPALSAGGDEEGTP